jgi:hypothetical protein
MNGGVSRTIIAKPRAGAVAAAELFPQPVNAILLKKETHG